MTPSEHPQEAAQGTPRPFEADNPRERARAAVWRAAATLLREAREARGWSQGELARRAGVRPGTVARYELGEYRLPRVEGWLRVTDALGLDLAQFLRDAETRAGASLRAGIIPRDAP
jgi:ribosome-binding protein aMBF1 (putative translation factor)